MDLDNCNDSLFHPLINRWFETRIGRPTPIQKKAWPLIASNAHVLVTAPTGSGKTLAAFLWALNQLIHERWETGQTHVLYVSPLKALNNDVQRNLIRPLTEIRGLFEKNEASFPDIRVLTRSGDTPSHARRQMIRRPPENLITTPESLHLMASSNGGRSMLGRIRTVILDEIHAVVGTKRGTRLISAVDRLVNRCGEFQRIALSATVKPEGLVAGFVGGFMIDGDKGEPGYIPRQVKRCRSSRKHHDSIHVRIPDAVIANEGNRSVWDDLAATSRQTIEKNCSTIIFVSSRRRCEKLTFLINADQHQPIAYTHHGSLSRELRLEVEQRLKRGDLKAIVATSSLELGIDIGSLDHVILVQSPPSISSTVQRIGRSGHGVGETSQAILFATHASDGLTAAVLAKAVMERDIEPVRPVECPLDILALLALYTSGGVIPDRGYFGLRHEETGARIGELDEAFVWETNRGQGFTLGTQNWRILRITHNDVFVRPARPKAPAPPFWRAEDADRDFFLSDKIARFLEVAQSQMAEQGFMDQLTSRYCMDSNGARFLSADALYAGRADIRWINLEGQQKRISDISSSKDGNTALTVGEIIAQWLDSLIQEAALIWVGRDRQQVAFCHAVDIDLMKNSAGELQEKKNHTDVAASDVTRLFPDSRGRYSLSALLGDPPPSAHQVLQQLWESVWEGTVTNDTMTALRRGIARGGKTAGQSQDRMTAGRGSMARPRRHRRKGAGSLLEGSVGNWYLIVNPQPPEGLMEVEEIVKDRVRLLLDRYGLLFRQLLSRELPVFQWPAIFRSLRLMELSGEAGSPFIEVLRDRFDIIVETRTVAVYRRMAT